MFHVQIEEEKINFIPLLRLKLLNPIQKRHYCMTSLNASYLILAKSTHTFSIAIYVSVLSSIEQKYIHLVTFGSNKPTEEGLIYLWCDPVLGMLSMCANYGLDDLTQRCWFSQLQKNRAISASYPAFIDKPNCFVV